MEKRWSAAGLLLLSALSASANWRLGLGLQGTARIPGDERLRIIYGKTLYAPEVRVRVRTVAGIFFWLGYGYGDLRGETQERKSALRWREDLLMAGVGYQFPLSSKLSLEVAAGYARLMFRESGMGMEESGSANGWLADAGLHLAVAKHWFLLLRGGYTVMEADSDDEPIGLGGIRAGIGIEWRR